MNTILPAIILKNTFSLTDFYQRVHVMQRFFEHLFFEAAGDEGERANLIRSYFRDSDLETQAHASAISAWGGEVLNEYTRANLYERVRELKQAVQACPKLTLYIPVHFSPMQVQRIGTWCRTNIRPDIVLDIRIHPASVGGCAFAYNSVLHDFSLSYFIKKQRPEMLKIVHAYDV